MHLFSNRLSCQCRILPFLIGSCSGWSSGIWRRLGWLLWCPSLLMSTNTINITTRSSVPPQRRFSINEIPLLLSKTCYVQPGLSTFTKKRQRLLYVKERSRSIYFRNRENSFSHGPLVFFTVTSRRRLKSFCACHSCFCSARIARSSSFNRSLFSFSRSSISSYCSF